MVYKRKFPDTQTVFCFRHSQFHFLIESRRGVINQILLVSKQMSTPRLVSVNVVVSLFSQHEQAKCIFESRSGIEFPGKPPFQCRRPMKFAIAQEHKSRKIN